MLSVPGMRESIREGMDTPVDECDEDWTGDMEVGLHQASPERAQRSWPPAASNQKPRNC